MAIDTTLPASDPNIFFLLTKMTETDQLKIIDNKIKANQSQYDLDRLAAKISAYSPSDLRKYEYLTGEDLNKPRDTNRVYLDKPDLIILQLVIFLLRDWIKMIKKKGFLRD